MNQFKSKFPIHLCITGLLILLNITLIRAQIFAPEGLNLPGTWNAFTNPPDSGSVFGNLNQVTNGKVKILGTGTPIWQTGFNVAQNGADVVEGNYTFLFTSGPTANAFTNKWAGVTVVIDTKQTYLYNGGADNSIQLTNGRYYTVNWKDNGYANTEAVFMRTTAKPVDIDSVYTTPADSIILPNQAIDVVALLSDTPSAEEHFYIRYTINAFASSFLVPMTINGNRLSGQIPVLPNLSEVSYYIFSSSKQTLNTDFDLYTLRFNNNEGANYQYSVYQEIVTVDLGPDVNFCPGSAPITLDAGEGYDTYSWNTGALTRTIQVSVADTYSVAVTKSGITAKDTLVVVGGTPFNFSLGPDVSICGSGTPVVLRPDVGLLFEGDSLTITYNSTAGIGNLEGASKVYMHSGISVSPQGQWSYTTGNWGLDDGIGRMTQIGENRWKITINPTAYYGLPPATSFSGIWMVFRNADGTVTGKNDQNQDIYLTVTGNPPYSSTFSGISAYFVPSPYQSIVWSTNQLSPTITVNQGGIYSATVSNGICTAKDSIQVNYLAAPPTIALPNDTAFCGTVNPFTLNAGSGFTSYLWSTGASTQTIAVSAPGTYKVKGTTSTGCSAEDSIRIRNNVSPVAVSLGNDVLLCGLDTVTLDPGILITPVGDSITIFYDASQGQSALVGEDTVYMHSTFEYVPFGGPVTPWVGNWGTNDGLGRMTSLGNNRWKITLNVYDYYSINPDTTINGLFMVFRNADGSKTGKDGSGNDIFLNVNSNPPSSLFAGVTATILASPFDAYLWSTNQTSSTIKVSTPGTYSVVLFGTNGCNVSDTILVQGAPAPAVNLGPDRVSCAGTGATLDAGQGFTSYLWSTGATNQIIPVGSGGSFSVTVTNAEGCSATDLVSLLVISAPNAAFAANEQDGLVVSFQDNSAGPAQYFWDFDGNGTTDNTMAGSVSYTYPSVGTYQPRLIVSNSCGADTLQISISLVGLGSQETPVADRITISPNPSADVFRIDLPESLNINQMRLFNSIGQSIIPAWINTNQFDLSAFPDGVYFLQITSDGDQSIKRLIKAGR
jgi:PKD repeat protein